MRTITVRPRDIQNIITATFPDYRGPKAQVRIQGHFEYHDYDLNWSGGSIKYLRALRVDPATGAFRVVAFESLMGIGMPSGKGFAGKVPKDVMLVEHCISCGHDLGIRCIVGPDSDFLPKLALPAVAELSKEEVTVLTAFASLKSAYRADALTRAGVHRMRAVEIVKALADRGLLKTNAAGASQITVEGRNALESLSAERRVML